MRLLCSLLGPSQEKLAWGHTPYWPLIFCFLFLTFLWVIPGITFQNMLTLEYLPQGLSEKAWTKTICNMLRQTNSTVVISVSGSFQNMMKFLASLPQNIYAPCACLPNPIVIFKSIHLVVVYWFLAVNQALLG